MLMDEEEYTKRFYEIIDEVSCWNGLENEVIKLFALFSKCATQKIDGQELLNVNYVREKVFNLLIEHPIILDAQARNLYIRMRIEREMSREKDDNI
jgi:hypothetical protein